LLFLEKGSILELSLIYIPTSLFEITLFKSVIIAFWDNSIPIFVLFVIFESMILTLEFPFIFTPFLFSINKT